MKKIIITFTAVLGLLVLLILAIPTVNVQAVETTKKAASKSSTTSPTLSNDTLFSVLTTDTKVVEKGQSIVKKNFCKICHVIEGKGGKKGDVLDGISKKLSPEKIKAAITDPKKINPNTVMKSYKMSDDDLNAVVAYLLTLPPPKEDK